MLYRHISTGVIGIIDIRRGIVAGPCELVLSFELGILDFRIVSFHLYICMN